MLSSRHLCLAASLVALSWSLPAQQDPAPKVDPPGVKKPLPKKTGSKPDAAKERNKTNDKKVLDRIKNRRKAALEGRRSANNVMCEIQLRNGSRLTGIVKQGRFVEKRKGTEFVKAKRSDPRCGVRLFYYNRTSSVMFITYSQIARVKEITRLSDVEVQRHGQSIKKRETEQSKRAKELAKQKIARIKARQRDREELDKLDGIVEKMEKDAKESAARAERAKLLKEFPPARNWGAARIKEIQRRKINGIYPTKEEIRFIQIFDDWSKALEESKVSEKSDKPAPEGSRK